MPFDDLDSAFRFIESFTNFEKTTPQSVRDFKKDRMVRLLGLFDRPEKRMKLYHIAGSKGKGSTGMFLASILQAAGYKTGLYTSPHVLSYRERITLAGRFIEEDLFLSSINRIYTALKGGNGVVLEGEDSEPTTFELLTLLAFVLFRETGCTHGVIETGIGGRLDATNIIDPEACMITPIELEHTDILGDTIESIAFEKAGIIKQGKPVFCGYQQPAAEEIITEKARQRNAPIAYLREEIQGSSIRFDGTAMEQSLHWRNWGPAVYRLGMLGEFQGENAALAVLAVKKLGLAGDEKIKKGLLQASLFGRLEIAGEEPPVVLDGAHTPSSLRRLLDSFFTLFPGPGICIFGSVTGKRIEEMARIIADRFGYVIVSTPGFFKKSDPRQVFTLVADQNDNTVFKPDPSEALQTALELSCGSRPILVTGSFYMIAEIKRLYVEKKAKIG